MSGQRHWPAAASLGVIATALVGLFGGFERAGAKAGAVPLVEGGRTIESEAFAVTPLCAWTSDLRPGQPASAASPGRRYLMLRAKVVNRAPGWLAMRAHLDKDVIWLPAGGGDPVWPERSQRADDATLGLSLGPGLPVLVDFVWELPPGMPPPARSTWGMFKRRHVARTYASGEEMWVQDGPGWKFEMPVSRACAGQAA